MHTQKTLMFPEETKIYRWFCQNGCVVADGDTREVRLGGNLIGEYDRSDGGARDFLMLIVGQEPSIKKGALAKTFEVTTEWLRKIRIKAEENGIASVYARQTRGAKRKLTQALLAKLIKLFDAGFTIQAAHAKVSGNSKKVSQSLVGMAHRQWILLRDSEQAERSSQAVLPLDDEVSPADAEPEESVPSRAIRELQPQSAKSVQHAGVWLLFGMLNLMGLYDKAQYAVSGKRERAKSSLRISLDAFIASLAIGQRCVEGVRRLTTPSAVTLLRASHCPSPPWVRKELGAAAGSGACDFHFEVATHFVDEAQQASDDDRPLVFYVDNHMRPYTGKEKIRKGWRMQDKRARAGVSDYYVHSESGLPVMRFTAPDHGHLTHWLPQLAQILRDALGPKARILVGFDRAGSFAEHLAELRNMGIEFVTYERKPYRELPARDFTHSFQTRGESIGYLDSRINLGKGRGRIRRVALRLSDAYQVNLLAVSTCTPEELYGIVRGRWSQENGFKHGNERWGINQLDGRTTESVEPNTIITNPARRELDRALRVARQHEGTLRCKLAKPAKTEAARQKQVSVRAELEEAVRIIATLKAQQPTVPRKAELKDTALAGKLKEHPDEYKMFMDTVRIACANVEAELATRLAPMLTRPAEAKKVLENLFMAPGEIRVSQKTISVILTPAGTDTELLAISELLEELSALGLSLPNDSTQSALRFRLRSQL